MIKRIKINLKDKIRGFGVLLTSKFSFHCLPNNEYIVSEDILERLRKQKIKFKEINEKETNPNTIS